MVNEDLSSVFILDNSPGAYRYNPENAIPIKSWFADPSDTALLNLLPMLDALRLCPMLGPYLVGIYIFTRCGKPALGFSCVTAVQRI